MAKIASHLYNTYSTDVQIFTTLTAVNTQGFQIWRKPKGCSMVYMFVLSGGGGGGGGFTRTAGSAGGGGGSGGFSNLTRFLCPAIFLPEVLYVQVGKGGAAGAASGAGTIGLNTYILTSKTAVLPNLVCYSGVNAPGGGGGGATGAAGTAGAVPSVPVTQPCNALGIWFTTVGSAGNTGGAQTGAAGTTGGSSGFLGTAGSGAGCTTTDFAGGSVIAPALANPAGSQIWFPGSANITAGGTAGTGQAGESGVNFNFNRLGFAIQAPGAGGGSNNSGTAGKGGDGGIGCGGGGGGAGTTGGAGGKGGDGIAIIISW